MSIEQELELALDKLVWTEDCLSKERIETVAFQGISHEDSADMLEHLAVCALCRERVYAANKQQQKMADFNLNVRYGATDEQSVEEEVEYIDPPVAIRITRTESFQTVECRLLEAGYEGAFLEVVDANQRLIASGEIREDGKIAAKLVPGKITPDFTYRLLDWQGGG